MTPPLILVRPAYEFEALLKVKVLLASVSFVTAPLPEIIPDKV